MHLAMRSVSALNWGGCVNIFPFLMSLFVDRQRSSVRIVVDLVIKFL